MARGPNRWAPNPLRHRRAATAQPGRRPVERARAHCVGRAQRLADNGQTCAVGCCAADVQCSICAAEAVAAACPTAESAGSCACVRACRAHRCTNREGGSCGGGFPAGGAGGAGRRTLAWLASVSIATTEAVGAAAVAVSSAPLWMEGVIKATDCGGNGARAASGAWERAHRHSAACAA